jgi:ADP-ribose pyrophosphatase YjhB (NUDIX family)
MGKDQRDLYYVALKLLLRQADKLLITHDIYGDWDLPGGRIRVDEFNKPLESVIDRKIKEELGPQVKYKLGEPKVFFRVQRQEQTLGQLVRIFAIGYEAEYAEGDVELGAHHDEMQWVDTQTFKAEDYFTGGWLEGVQEYLRLVKALRPET